MYWGNRQIAWLAQVNEYLTHFIHTNALGSTTQVTDQTGNIATGISGNLEDLGWYPFGAQWTNAGSWADTLFAGMEPYRWGYGLNFTPNRYHAPRLGRWLTPDPGNAGADPSNPQSWNAYSYAGNNPTTNTDPSGLKCIQLDDGAFADDMTGGGCDKSGVDPNGNIRPDSVQIKGKQGSWATAVGVNAFLELSNIANDFFAPLIGMRPSFMQNTPTGSGTAAEIGAGAAILGTALIGPEGELEDGIRIAEGRLTKVLEAHTVGGVLVTGTKSLFDNPEEVRGLIQAAESVTPVRQASGRLERVVDAARIIGTDRNTGRATSIYTVITDASGNLITAFPGRP